MRYLVRDINADAVDTFETRDDAERFADRYAGHHVCDLAAEAWEGFAAWAEQCADYRDDADGLLGDIATLADAIRRDPRSEREPRAAAERVARAVALLSRRINELAGDDAPAPSYCADADETDDAPTPLCEPCDSAVSAALDAGAAVLLESDAGPNACARCGAAL